MKELEVLLNRRWVLKAEEKELYYSNFLFNRKIRNLDGSIGVLRGQSLK